MAATSTTSLSVLPISLPPIGINREQAAYLIGVSASTFDKAVAAGSMPQPRRLVGRLLWDVEEIRRAFSTLPHRDSDIEEREVFDLSRDNPWDAAQVKQ